MTELYTKDTIWIKLKSGIGCFVECNWWDIYLYPRRRPDYVLIYLSNFADGMFQLCNNDKIAISLEKFHNLGHRIEITIPKDEIKLISRESYEQSRFGGREWIELWKETES